MTSQFRPRGGKSAAEFGCLQRTTFTEALCVAVVEIWWEPFQKCTEDDESRAFIKYAKQCGSNEVEALAVAYLWPVPGEGYEQPLGCF
mmetsp:Transcript_570/g.1310  ORF Transcript_570/g.1310 Transcript_570/m.1310 type:complete len:88 (+) Transcript_570:500-763(+)